MLSIPIIAGALMRFLLGIFSKYTGRQRAELVGLVTGPAQKPGYGPGGREQSGHSLIGAGGACASAGFWLGRGYGIATVTCSMSDKARNAWSNLQ